MRAENPDVVGRSCVQLDVACAVSAQNKMNSSSSAEDSGHYNRFQRSPNILLIPGTSSGEHLRKNVAGAGFQLPHEAIKELNVIAG
jgi:hypothetical protein